MMKMKQTYLVPQAQDYALRTIQVMMSSIGGSGDAFGNEGGSYGDNSGENLGTETGQW